MMKEADILYFIIFYRLKKWLKEINTDQIYRMIVFPIMCDAQQDLVVMIFEFSPLQIFSQEVPWTHCPIQQTL